MLKKMLPIGIRTFLKRRARKFSRRCRIISISLRGLIESYPWSDKKTRRRLFIDCGSNLGQGFGFFNRLYPLSLYDFVLIEPNPNCVQILRSRHGDDARISLIEAAVWTGEEQLSFFGVNEGGKGEFSDGGSLVREHNSGMYDHAATDTLVVKAIDFVQLLRSYRGKYSDIVIKMDIESAEYQVLPKLIESGELESVRHIYIEFHSHFMKEPERSRHLRLETEIKAGLSRHGVKYTVWF